MLDEKYVLLFPIGVGVIAFLYCAGEGIWYRIKYGKEEYRKFAQYMNEWLSGD